MQRCYPVQAGQFVLMHAAAGGVGLLAGQWGRHLGAQDDRRGRRPREGAAGAGQRLCRTASTGYTEDIPARVKAITGGAGVPVVYDSVGKDSFDAIAATAWRRAASSSRFGTTTGAPPPVAASTLQKMGSLYFTRPTLVTYTASTEDLRASAAAVFDMFARGRAQDQHQPALRHERHRPGPCRPGGRAHHRVERDPSLNFRSRPEGAASPKHTRRPS